MPPTSESYKDVTQSPSAQRLASQPCKLLEEKTREGDKRPARGEQELAVLETILHEAVVGSCINGISGHTS